MTFSPDALWADLQAHWPSQASGELCVAFSGGLDSTVLLTALSRSVRAHPEFRLRAIHIDHQLQPASREWSERCIEVARTLQVDCISHRVFVNLNLDEGVEAAAREARYSALREMIRPGEVLLTAHHADDQLETVLLALTRGSGLPGLSAMPSLQSFAPGWHMRPMLSFTRDRIERWATEESLNWISDPSNDHAQFSRNVLRSEVTPALRRRWPAIARTASRSAAHAADANLLLDELAQLDLANASNGSCLQVAVLASLSSPRRRNLLRYWLRERGARAPSARKLVALEHDVLHAAADRSPRVHWDGFEVRRYRGLLYAGLYSATDNEPQAKMWDWRVPLELSAELGQLKIARTSTKGLDESRLPAQLRVDFRRGGERLQPANRKHHHTLKKLLQTADVLPWWRNRLPLIWSGDELVAVGDLWVAEEFTTQAPGEAMQIVWEGRPKILATSPCDGSLP